MAATILIIEDDPEDANLLATALKSAARGVEVRVASSARAGVAALEQDATDCVLLDYRLPDSNGLTCLRTIRNRKPDVPVVIITGAGSEEVAVEAMKLGAADYLVKRGRYVLMVPVVVQGVLGRRVLEKLAARTRPRHPARGDGTSMRWDRRERYRLAGIIGESDAIEHAIVLAEKAVDSRVTVLLEGETGTGKELFARAIHEHGSRSRNAFLAQNCAALPDTLLESELFGYARGAFTGADRDHKGLFEQADGGTLLLDEIGETNSAVQAKLLRVLQEGEVRPVGGDYSRRVDVRVIAASNRCLSDAVGDGTFRRDLYYRLSTFPIRLPALRERREDIALLATHFLVQACEQEGRFVPGFSPAALKLLIRYDWPGNVRELRNEVHRLVLCAETAEPIVPSQLSPAIRAWHPGSVDVGGRTLKDIMRQVELATIQTRLLEYGYSRTQTAQSLGLTREGLWVKLRRLRFTPPSGGPRF